VQQGAGLGSPVPYQRSHGLSILITGATFPMKRDYYGRALRAFGRRAWFLLLPWALVGCGASTAKVTGTVYQKNGKPLTGGRILMFPRGSNTGKMASGIIDPNGKYVVEGAPVGPVTVVIDNLGLKGEVKRIGEKDSAPKRDGSRMGRFMGPPKDAMKDKNPPAPTERAQGSKLEGTYVAIPEKYTDANKSTLTFDVEKGENNNKDFKLE
jgi:hypothetical protein